MCTIINDIYPSNLKCTCVCLYACACFVHKKFASIFTCRHIGFSADNAVCKTSKINLRVMCEKLQYKRRSVQTLNYAEIITDI